MSGRQTYRAECAYPDCRERAFYDGLTVHDRGKLAERQRRFPWHCTRHQAPDQVLAAGNQSRTTVAIATRLIEGSSSLFWVPEASSTGSGFAHGIGFKAWADDFPEGTRLVVTASVETTTHPDRPSGGADQTTETEETT